MFRPNDRNRAHAMSPSLRACGPIPTDVLPRLAWTRAQATHETCQLQKRLVDVILPLDEHTVAQRGFKLLADTIADDVLSRHVVCLSRHRDRVGELGRQINVNPRHPRFAHSELYLLDNESNVEMGLSAMVGNGFPNI
jgi:hypothetical protein